jgi:hypothetical protein
VVRRTFQFVTSPFTVNDGYPLDRACTLILRLGSKIALEGNEAHVGPDIPPKMRMRRSKPTCKLSCCSTGIPRSIPAVAAALTARSF